MGSEMCIRDRREYAATAKDPDAWAQFRTDWLELESHEAYRAKLEERGQA